MIVYLTFNDLPSGVFKSQVLDVCRFYQVELKKDITLVSFVSIRVWRKVKRQLSGLPFHVVVLPMFPKHRNWKKNTWLLRRKIKSLTPKTVICRGPLAACLALQARTPEMKVIFDARGAYAAEFSEYLDSNSLLNDKMENHESRALKESDGVIAVSRQLVKWWNEKYAFIPGKYVVIPCTLSSDNHTVVSETKRTEIRKKFGFSDNDLIMVYSGSSAEWQSLNNLKDWLEPVLRQNPVAKLLVLTPASVQDNELSKLFPGRVSSAWLQPEKVQEVLSCCDYGLLLREDTVTNRVASPTKFAEYLAAGLPVMISHAIGDYSEFVIKHDCGYVLQKGNSLQLYSSAIEKKQQMKQLAVSFFTKKVHEKAYLEILSER
ncbi:MAG: glycosyltransferase [Bacteroidota bacterium]